MLNDTPMPTYIAVASLGSRAIAYGHFEEIEEARTWMVRAQEVFLETADQLLLGRMHEVDWISGFRGPSIVPIEGWVRVAHAWQAQVPVALRVDFQEIGSGPTNAEDLVAVPAEPTGRAARKAAPGADRELRIIATNLVSLSQGIRALAAVARPVGSGRRRVLLVDDDTVSRRATKQALRDHDVTEADSFTSALLELAHWDFDCVITDHDMGRVGTGLDLLNEVRERWPRTRRVLCTGAEQADLGDWTNIVHKILGKPVQGAAVLASLDA